jgi:hypothetical protein
MNKSSKNGAVEASKLTVCEDSFVIILGFGKVLNFILLWLGRLRLLLERHFPKYVVMLLFLPFAVLFFLFGWLMITLVSDDL